MSTTLTINNNCIRCHRCVKVCPAKIFASKQKGDAVSMANVEDCIVCGHCVAACPTDSIAHSAFPEEKVHHFDAAQMPTPEQVMLLCKTRRSNRAFSKKPIPQEVLSLIVEAAHRAPTASNTQNIRFTIITAPEKLALISDFTINTFQKVFSKLTNPFLTPIIKMIAPQLYRYVPSFKRLLQEKERGNDLILRGATAVLLIHAPRSSRYGLADSALAYQNGSLMAESLHISQFYTGFVCAAIKQNKKGTLENLLGIQGEIHSGMALGIPEFSFSKYIDKQDVSVNYIK